jgi:UDP-N-acetylglucosamine transferase subunit ALG13
MAQYVGNLPERHLQGEFILIFITLGTQRFAMNRVIDEIDSLIEKSILNSQEVVIQNGYSKESKYSKCNQMMTEMMFDDLMSKCELIITHGGTSSIIKALRNHKKTIIIPRKAEFKEHVDDHQKEICDVFKAEGYAEVIEEMRDLNATIQKVQLNDYKPMNLSNQLSQYILEEVLNLK